MASSPAFIYCDNAATSFPKPEVVSQAMAKMMAESAVSPGRSGFDLGLCLGREVDGVRGQLNRLFANPANDPNRVVFTNNATDAINLALSGLCRTGDHVIATVMDHNAVLRPLWMLRERGLISFDLAPADSNGFVDPAAIAKLFRTETRLVVMTHASNICGAIQPAAEVGSLCRERGVHFLLDAAQTAGALEVNMAALGCDLLAFTGHKSLLGPTGIGGLVVGPNVDLQSSRWGGTGVRSAQRAHLDEYPYRLEAGTLNTVGIVGLGASLHWLAAQGIAKIQSQEAALAQQFRRGLSQIKGLKYYGQPDGKNHLPVVALNLDHKDAEAVGLFLDVDWNLAVRTGLHCAPLANNALGIGPDGSVRFSFGPFNASAEIDRALTALETIAKS